MTDPEEERQKSAHEYLVRGTNRRMTFGWIGILLVIIAIVWFAVPKTMGTRHSPWTIRAQSTLRSCGSSQLAYQDTNNNKNYGSFQNLVDSLYIADGYSLGNMIENYSMTWEISSSSVVLTEGPVKSDRFTIIAFPRDTREGYLNTFGIAEDQIIRVYTPDNDFDRVKTWDPIL